MPGPLRTFSNVFQPENAPDYCRELHAGVVKYFDAHPGFQRIASNYGVTTGISGSGLSGSYAYVSASAENAWVVYRAVSSSISYDLAFVWSYSVNYAPNTWTAATTYGPGMALAYHPSGAWSGSIGNTGTDTFFSASTPWRSGSFVMPRANSQGGFTPTTKNSLMKFMPSGAPSGLLQFYILGDNETTYMWLQGADSSLVGDVNCFAAFGQYQPLTQSYNLPLFGYAGTTLPAATVFGGVTASDPGGTAAGGLSYTTESDFRSYKMEYPIYAAKRAPRPAPSLLETNSKAYGFPVTLSSFEAGHYHNVGILSGVYAIAGNAFGNIQDVSRSFVSVKITNSPQNVSFLLPFSGSTDFFSKGTFE